MLKPFASAPLAEMPVRALFPKQVINSLRSVISVSKFGRIIKHRADRRYQFFNFASKLIVVRRFDEYFEAVFYQLIFHKNILIDIFLVKYSNVSIIRKSLNTRKEGIIVLLQCGNRE